MRENGLMPNRAWCMATLRTSTKTRLGHMAEGVHWVQRHTGGGGDGN